MNSLRETEVTGAIPMQVLFARETHPVLVLLIGHEAGRGVEVVIETPDGPISLPGVAAQFADTVILN